MSADWGPRSNEIAAFIAALPTWPWLRPPAEVSEAEIEAAVAEHIEALRPYGYRETPAVRVVRAWDAAWDAARAAAVDSARDAAGSTAWDAARAAAVDSARDAAGSTAWAAARIAAWAAARDAAWAAARDAAWAAAWAAARDATWMIGMPGPSPWRPLLDIWRGGLWPIGVVGDEFVVFHPEVR